MRPGVSSKRCALFVPIVSANTDARSEGYLRLEWKLAVDLSHLIAEDDTFLLPVASAALLGPAAVAPAWQGRSVGRDLVRFGLQRLKTENVAVVCALANPAYYGRLGFAPEVHVEPPFQLPREWADAWQSKCLDEAAAPCVGKLAVPPPWMRRDLWAP